MFCFSTSLTALMLLWTLLLLKLSHFSSNGESKTAKYVPLSKKERRRSLLASFLMVNNTGFKSKNRCKHKFVHKQG